jgi:hypothetical protein
LPGITSGHLKEVITDGSGDRQALLSKLEKEKEVFEKARRPGVSSKGNRLERLSNVRSNRKSDFQQDGFQIV